MYDYRNIAGAQMLNGMFENRKIIASADKSCGLRVDRLKSEFNPDWFDLVQFTEKIQNFFA